MLEIETHFTFTFDSCFEYCKKKQHIGLNVKTPPAKHLWLYSSFEKCEESIKPRKNKGIDNPLISIPWHCSDSRVSAHVVPLQRGILHHVLLLSCTWQQLINIRRALDKAAQVGPAQRLSPWAIIGTNTKHYAESWCPLYSGDCRGAQDHILPLQPLYLQSDSNFLKYNECRISLTCSRGEGVVTVWSAFKLRGRKIKPSNVCCLKWDIF